IILRHQDAIRLPDAVRVQGGQIGGETIPRTVRREIEVAKRTQTHARGRVKVGEGDFGSMPASQNRIRGDLLAEPSSNQYRIDGIPPIQQLLEPGVAVHVPHGRPHGNHRVSPPAVVDGEPTPQPAADAERIDEKSQVRPLAGAHVVIDAYHTREVPPDSRAVSGLVDAYAPDRQRAECAEVAPEDRKSTRLNS